MYSFENIEKFYEENRPVLLEGELRPGKSWVKDPETCFNKFRGYKEYCNTHGDLLTKSDIAAIGGLEETNNLEQYIHNLLDFDFLRLYDDGKYRFSSVYNDYVESGVSAYSYILEKMYKVSSLETITKYLNYLICTLREAYLEGSVITFQFTYEDFARDVTNLDKRKEYIDRAKRIYNYEGRRGNNDNYSPNITYMAVGPLRNLGLLFDDGRTAEGMKKASLTPNGYHYLIELNERLGAQLNNSNEIPLNDENHQDQVIYFGAPGTGKSHQLERDTSAFSHLRTIFHPDSDYASFVGCYKPVMEGDKIVYRFRPQAFITAYVNAWLTNEPYYLIIEEINRGNCAQIFGDIFQLLDRKNGVSDYTIVPDTDLKNYLYETFHSETNRAIIQQKQLSIPEDILNGTGMRLPANFFLRATMNTSDQSLFPMDSAFKRRWAWKHFSIKDEGKQYTVVVDDDHQYDWWRTIETLNGKIYSETKSADKQLGYWFAKLPRNKTVISKEDFVSKVLFYLWNDVFKDYSFDSKNAFSEEIQFDKFFTSDGQIDPEMVIKFMDKNGIVKNAVESKVEDTSEEEQ